MLEKSRNWCISKTIVFRRSTKPVVAVFGFIFSLALAFFSALIIYYAIGELALGIMVGICHPILWFTVMVRSFMQPSKVTLRNEFSLVTLQNEDVTIVGNNKFVCNSNQVRISVHKINIFVVILVIFLLGLLPGIFFFLALGDKKIRFDCGERIFVLRYVGGRRAKQELLKVKKIILPDAAGN